MRDARQSDVPDDTPDEVRQRAGREVRTPQTDPTVGVALPPRSGSDASPAHRLVVIGDSLSQGFQSGAIFNTGLSYGAIIAHELGWPNFRYPEYPAFGGLPLNMEFLLRELESEFGSTTNLAELPRAVYRLRNHLNEIEEYWERGAGAGFGEVDHYNHALAVFGWDLRDALEKTAATCARATANAPNNRFVPMVQRACEVAALRVYPSWSDEVRQQTLFQAARALGDDDTAGTGEGIETLVVFIGGNNALSSVCHLAVRWSQDDGYRAADRKKRYTVWQPEHFRQEFNLVVEEVKSIKAKNVIWCTVPHVTIGPAAKGVDSKSAPRSRYYDYYTRPWIDDADFDPRHDPFITGAQARAVDYAIDSYNDAIEAAVRSARLGDDGTVRNWYLLDTAGMLDRLAWSRYIDDPIATPAWWTPYPLPTALQRLDPQPDTQFLTADGQGGRRTGGLISLDGVHPTTVAYGILAQELISIMEQAGVRFLTPAGAPRQGPIEVDFERLIRLDTLVTSPPQNLASTLGIVGWMDNTLDVFSRLFGN